MVRPMRKTKNKKWILFAIWFVFSATFFGPGAYRAPASDGLFLKHVRIDKTILSPGEKVMISYYLSEDAQVTLLIYNPDYQVVRTLLDEQQRPAGTNTAFWDGFDGTGAMVPDEAYIFSISAKNSSGRETVYDPTAHSGGEEMDLGFDRVDEADGHYTMSYHVPVPARISIRAGVHKGPMLKNILEWKVFLPGDYTWTWDGLDETGRIRVMEEPGSILYIRGFRLPENSIIVQGSGRDYQPYPGITSPAVERARAVSFESVKKAALKRSATGISSQYLVRQALSRAPRFTVYLPPAKSTRQRIPPAEIKTNDVSGTVGLTVEVDPESMASFNELRYEIVVFIDNRRFDEEESAYSPYTYMLDTTKLSNGRHSVTINLSSLTGQVSAYSLEIDVNN